MAKRAKENGQSNISEQIFTWILTFFQTAELSFSPFANQSVLNIECCSVGYQLSQGCPVLVLGGYYYPTCFTGFHSKKISLIVSTVKLHKLWHLIVFFLYAWSGLCGVGSKRLTQPCVRHERWTPRRERSTRKPTLLKAAPRRSSQILATSTWRRRGKCRRKLCRRLAGQNK